MSPDRAAGTPAAPSAVVRVLPPLLAVTFIGTMGFSIILPFLVFLVTRLGGNAPIYGALVATYSVFQLVGAPLLGRWSDAAGRRRVLLLSQLGTLGAWVLFMVALLLPSQTLVRVDTPLLGTFVITGPLLLLFAARALDGLTGGNVSVANAYLADITPQEQRSVGFGKMAVASNLGFVLGPAIGGILGATALRELPPVGAAIVMSVIAALLIAWRLPDVSPCVLVEGLPGEHTRKLMGQEQRDCYSVHASGPGEDGWPPAVKRLLALSFLVYLAFNFFYVGFPMRAAEDLGWSPMTLGLYFAGISLLMAAVQGLILPWAADRFSDARLVWSGGVILGAAFLLFTGSVPLLALGGAALALGNGLMWPSLQGLLSRAADGPHQGAVQGAAGSVAAGASIFGLVLGGVAYAALGPGLFWVAAAITGVVVVLSLGWLSSADVVADT